MVVENQGAQCKTSAGKKCEVKRFVYLKVRERERETKRWNPPNMHTHTHKHSHLKEKKKIDKRNWTKHTEHGKEEVEAKHRQKHEAAAAINALCGAFGLSKQKGRQTGRPQFNYLPQRTNQHNYKYNTLTKQKRYTNLHPCFALPAAENFAEHSC